MLRVLPTLDLVLWAVATLVTVILLGFILTRRLDLKFPFLTAYLGVNFLQTIAQVVVYETYGFESDVTYSAVWASQAVVILARGLATGEFCYALLGRYLGVWTLAKRILLLCGGTVLGLSIYFGKDGFRYGVITLEMASEACIATLVAGAFVFARYYGAELGRNLAFLGLGLGLNSCVKILNDAVLTRYLRSYDRLWNDVAIGAFIVVLVLWIAAMRATSMVNVPKPELADANLYRTLAPQTNQRLVELNQQLIRLWKLEQRKL